MHSDRLFTTSTSDCSHTRLGVKWDLGLHLGPSQNRDKGESEEAKEKGTQKKRRKRQKDRQHRRTERAHETDRDRDREWQHSAMAARMGREPGSRLCFFFPLLGPSRDNLSFQWSRDSGLIRWALDNISQNTRGQSEWSHCPPKRKSNGKEPEEKCALDDWFPPAPPQTQSHPMGESLHCARTARYF